MQRTFWVYVMASTTGTLYMGITNDLAEKWGAEMRFAGQPLA